MKIKEFDSVFKEKLHQINFVCSTSEAAMKLQAYFSCTADLKMKKIFRTLKNSTQKYQLL